MSQGHATKVKKMRPSNPFYSLGYRWEWECLTCKTRGGTCTETEGLYAAEAHRKKTAEAIIQGKYTEPSAEEKQRGIA